MTKQVEYVKQHVNMKKCCILVLRRRPHLQPDGPCIVSRRAKKRCLNFCASALCKLHVPTYQKILGEMAIIWYNFSLAEAMAIMAHHHDHPTNWPNDVPASLALKIACAASSGFVSVSVDLRCFCLPKSASTRTCQIRDQSHGNIGLHFKICSKASRAASKAAVQQMPCRHAMIWFVYSFLAGQSDGSDDWWLWRVYAAPWAGLDLHLCLDGGTSLQPGFTLLIRIWVSSKTKKPRQV